MNIKQELSKVKLGFGKVKNDMIFLSNKIGENYDNFMKEHDKLAKDVHKISNDLNAQISDIKTKVVRSVDPHTEQELAALKAEIRELKHEVALTHTEHNKLSKVIDDVKGTKADVKDLKGKLNSSELEIYLLKEKLVEKDAEIKSLKEISRKLFDLIDELSKVELDLVNMSKEKKVE